MNGENMELKRTNSNRGVTAEKVVAMDAMDIERGKYCFCLQILISIITSFLYFKLCSEFSFVVDLYLQKSCSVSLVMFSLQR